MTQTMDETAHLKPEEVSAYVDGELNSDQAEGFLRHLESCHRCSLRVLAETQVKGATAREGARFAPSAETLARLSATLHRETQERRGIALVPRFRVRRIAWTALAASIVLLAFFVGWRQVRNSNALAAEIVDQHLAMLSNGATPEIESTDRHTVKPWFQGRLPFSFNLPEADALPRDTTLRGADLAYIDGQPAAQLIFTIGKHEASVFLTQKVGTGLVRAPGTRAGFNLRTATTAELRITAVSDVNPAQLDALVTAVEKVQ
jgi:anti-sigma factor RsiW